MLDPNITRHVETALQVKASEFAHRIKKRIAKIRHSAQPGNSRAILLYAQVFHEELDGRALYVFDEIKRALQLHRPQLDNTIANWLDGLHITETRRQCTELQRLIAELFDTPAVRAFGLSPAAQLQGPLNEQCDRLREKYTFEISNLVRELRQIQQEQPAPPVTINNSGNIGALQTGAGATATVAMNVREGDRAALLAAIEQLGAALQSAQQLNHEQQRHALDIIEQLKAVAQEEAPKPALLRGLLVGLGYTVQTIAAVRPAWDLVRSAAQPLGIKLPPVP